jgi:hypothetical protein
VHDKIAIHPSSLTRQRVLYAHEPHGVPATAAAGAHAAMQANAEAIFEGDERGSGESIAPRRSLYGSSKKYTMQSVEQDYDKNARHEPIRLHVEYLRSRSPGWASLEAKARALMAEPLAFWKKALKVRPIKGPLRFDGHGGATTTCLDVPIPRKWMKGVKGASGLSSTDMAIMVATEPTEDCKSDQATLAYASPCLFDHYDRPILALINFCPNKVFRCDSTTGELNCGGIEETDKFNHMKDLASHELAHALGFNMDRSWSWRDTDGKTPRTPRLNDGSVAHGTFTCLDGTRNHQPQIANTTLRIGRPSTEKTTKPHFKIVTPTVAAVAKAHYGCSTEIGAELENQGDGTSCFGSHWEEKTMLGELMTASQPVYGARKVVSAFTLAAFADMGFYKVDMSLAKPLPWGYNAGCDFVNKKCFPPRRRKAKGEGGRSVSTSTSTSLPSRYFCHAEEAGEEMCSFDRKSKGSCVVKRWADNGGSIPVEFQYFQDPLLGGSSKMLDYCPVVEEFTNGNCEDASLGKDPNYSDLYKIKGEKYGPGSRCVISTLVEKTVIIPKSGSSMLPKHACMMTRCSSVDAGSASITITAFKTDGSTKEVKCEPGEGGVKKSIPGYSGKIVCPDPDIICVEPRLLQTAPRSFKNKFSLRKSEVAPLGSTKGSKRRDGKAGDKDREGQTEVEEIVLGLLASLLGCALLAIGYTIFCKRRNGRAAKGGKRKTDEWTRHFDPERGVYYYFQASTGNALWTLDKP